MLRWWLELRYHSGRRNPIDDITNKGSVLRKSALLMSACSILLFAAFAQAQQIDLALGASTVYSSGKASSAQGFVPPAEKSGMYPTFSADVLFKKKQRLGVNLNIAVRAKQGLYNGYQDFRPIFIDANAVYVARTSKRTRAEFMGGIGVETLLFYNSYGACNSAYSTCINHLNSEHFMAHVGGGVRYYFWRRFFVRPEIHLYVIPNNYQFNSDYVGRAAVTLGYSLTPR
jgi:hypothetical protein